MFHRSSSASSGAESSPASDKGGSSSIGYTQDLHTHTSPTKSLQQQQQQQQPQQQQQHLSGRESLLRFLLLPRQVLIVLTLEFLNSFRSFGLRFVLYNYVTNEFGISDVQAGALLGTKGFVDILFGLAGSIMVDVIGVRKISIIAMSIAIIGRTLLAFGRSTTSLYLALFLFSPCGDALLSTGLYRVALKKLTTPLTRPLAFAISYAVSNLAGAVADICVDRMRSTLKDVQIEQDSGGAYFSGVYTPMRQFIVVTWVIVLVTFVIAYCYLEDWTVIDPNDLDDDEKLRYTLQQRNQSSSIMMENETVVEDDDATTSIIPLDALPALPMIRPHLLQRLFPTHYDSIHAIEDDEHHLDVTDEDFSTSITTRRSLPKYQMYRTKYTRETRSQQGNSCCLVQLINQVIAILKLRNTWRVLIFGFLSFTIVLDWTASELVLPPFLERRFGEKIPIYTIQSINLFGCLILPPFVGALTTGREDFQIVMPGLWLMALSPIFVALFPNVGGACIWQIVMTIGEVLWSPRNISWTASLAPTGMEGLFFAISSARAILGPLSDMVMGAMNDKYNTNCLNCRDQYGHFCDIAVNNDNADAAQCVSVQEECNLYLDNQQQKSCPRTCLECPTFVPTDPSTFWYLLMIAGIVAPLSVWLFLPFLRGARVREDKFYGLFRANKARLLGICGAPDEDVQEGNIRRRQGRQVYGQLENNNSSTSAVTANEMDIELTLT